MKTFKQAPAAVQTTVEPPVKPEVLVLEKLKEMTQLIRSSRRQDPGVVEVAARYEQRFNRELAELKSAA